MKNKKLNHRLLAFVAVIFFNITCVYFNSCQSPSVTEESITYSIIPQPHQIKSFKGQYNIPDSFVIVSGVFDLGAIKLNDWSRSSVILGRDFEIVPTSKSTYEYEIKLSADNNIRNAEGYNLTISAKGIFIKARQEKGVFYAFQTLRQLILNSSNGKIPYIEINDEPRYGYRGLMLDTARHFLSVENIKRYIDVMAFYKFNRLHLHLTDNQGWRIEINEYPKLVEIASKRKETNGNNKPHEGYYAKEDLEDLVAYAKSKCVEIIPEIDMPGHNQAALAAYPNLACFPDPENFEVRTTPGRSYNIMCAGKEEVYDFYETVLHQVAEIFPYPEIHVGGDEAPLVKWENCPHCQKVIRDENLENEEELMSYFFTKIEEILKRFNKKPIFWHEDNVASYPKNGTVYLWKNGKPKETMEAIRERNLNMINAYGKRAYFDFPQWEGDGPSTSWMPVLSLELAYDFDPSFGLLDDEDDFIVGVQGCLWGEYMPNMNKVFYMSYPRAMALSEAGWSVEKNKSWEKFKLKLPNHLNYLGEKGILYRPPVEIVFEEENGK